MLFLHRKVLFWMVVVVVVGVSGECGNKTTSAPSWGWGWAGAELGNKNGNGTVVIVEMKLVKMKP